MESGNYITAFKFMVRFLCSQVGLESVFSNQVLAIISIYCIISIIELWCMYARGR